MRPYSGVFVLPFLPLLACGDVATPELPAFQTNAREYTLTVTSVGYKADIGFVYTNPNNSPTYIVNCNGSTSLRLDKLLDGVWVRAWRPVLPACLSPPIIVAGRAQYQGVVRVVDCSFRTNCAPKFTVSNIPGQYRIVWGQVLSSYDDRKSPFGEPLPLEQQTSNTFTILTSSL